MTETSARRVVSVSFPTLATRHLWRGPNPTSQIASLADTSGASHDAALLDAIKETERLAHWCGRYTPWTAMDDWGGIWLDISGCQHLFGGERGMLEDLHGRLGDMGYESVIAAADTPGAAWAAARFPLPPPPTGICVLASGTQRKHLAPLPVSALRIGAAAEGLRRLGLRRVGDLYDVARAPLAARFGAHVLKRLDQALGHVDEPISPIRPAPARRVRITFPDPIALRDDLWLAFERLAAALMQRLSEAGDGATGLELAGYRADGTLARLSVATGRASRNIDHFKRLFAEKFDALDPGFGIEVMVLAAMRTEPLGANQADLSGAGRKADDLARLVDRLGNRLGDTRLGAIAPAESHVPERAQVSSRPFMGERQDERNMDQSPTLPRPLHLLSPPEPVEAMAPVPDGPPALFRWRRHTYKVARADGPERIAPEWWLEDPARLASGQARIRDYYHVEDETGRRYWLYRDGLYQSDKAPKWYLHGLFG